MYKKGKKMLELNETTFVEAMKDDKPVVVDYFASWCGPCRATAPKFNEYAEKYSDKATFAKINIDDAEKLALDHRINTIPTFLVFKNGKEVKRWSGLPSESQLLEEIG